ncbi:bifunctional Aminoacyl-tRNA synthetase [Babesia duncani]|uniref:valine--tRNA ligase n=1 Tax=Babesia duncani TaxID=323732 RepID=A0AAD9UNU6_9APIC|nr:bifunctional Aminoacyl-tRNA synthetase [Babesia duncani]
MATRVEKKLVGELASSYNPTNVEKEWYQWWTSSGLFTPSNKEEADVNKKRWVAVLPPPNVTGSLHIGHALTISIQDCLARWHRMKGDVTLWIPGTDHAGIATQTVVERMLMQTEQKTRHDLGREAFIEKVFEWNDKYGNNIKSQLCRMGASLDWTRDAFTMDKKRSAAVIEAFIQMYDAGLIYRATRLVSWCPHLSTALSDIEVDQFEVTAPTRIKIPGFNGTVEVGTLWIFNYTVDTPEKDKFISVATTRIETMLGDVGIAVHPDDERYKEFVGCTLIHPFISDRKMVVVADKHVDPSYGTGAVKLTPAHDKNDFEIAKRHNLQCINIFTNDGKINDNGGEFSGMHRFECRKLIEQRLKDINLFQDKIPNTKPMMIPRCSRTSDIVEYMIIPQWYVDCKQLGKDALDLVKSGELTIIPQSYVSVWEMWLSNIQDWCISRQLWWGHRIPAYKVVCDSLPKSDSDKWIIASSLEKAHEKMKQMYPEISNYTLQQDEDVLDTWFSSGIFPLSTLGWPNLDDLDYKKFFPTTLLETGNDILFFWVARMVMMSRQLVGKLPFSHVYLHPLVRDARGEKMSKSKGNVIDPLEVIDGTSLENLNNKILNSTLPQGEIKKSLALQKQQFPSGIPACGADALRLGLLSLTRQNRTILLDVNKIVCCKHFGNKIWNATKFTLMKIKDRTVDTVGENQAWEDKWILNKLNAYIKRVTTAFEGYQFGDAVQAAYDFWIYDLCDYYLELVKSRLPNVMDDNVTITKDMESAIYSLNNCLCVGFRLLHPIMPFITEELYHHLPAHLRQSDSICTAKFPEVNNNWKYDEIDSEMDIIKAAVHSMRSLSAVLGLGPQIVNKIGYLVSADPKTASVLTKLSSQVAILSKFEKVTVEEPTFDFSGCVGDVVNANLCAYIKVDHSVDLESTMKKLKVKLETINSSLNSYYKKTQAKEYYKVPESVRQLNDEKIKELSIEKGQLTNALGDLERLSLLVKNT